MTSAQEVETLVAQTSPIREYFHPEDHIVTSTIIDINVRTLIGRLRMCYTWLADYKCASLSDY